MPHVIVSLSECLCDFIPDAWAIDWANISYDSLAKFGRKFGLSESRLEEVIDWTTRRINSNKIGWASVFFSLGDAQEFAVGFYHRNPHTNYSASAYMKISQLSFCLKNDRRKRKARQAYMLLSRTGPHQLLAAIQSAGKCSDTSGAKVTKHAKYVTFQLAEVAVPRRLFAGILDRIARLALPPPLVE